jgi:hypothetical protein
MVQNDEIYLKAFEEAQAELDELMAKRAELDSRISRLRETVVSLGYLVNDRPESESLSGIGLTEAVAKVLRISGMALTPANIRDELARMGFNTKRYSDVIPSITKVLQRLHKKGHVDISRPSAGERKFYIWSPMQPESTIWGFYDSTTPPPEQIPTDPKLVEAVREVFGRRTKKATKKRAKKNE